MSTDNFGSLGADFFIKTYDKGSAMSQADLDELVRYVQLTTTILVIGDFTPDEQQSVWMILERVDVNSVPGFTVSDNTDVTMTSGGLVTINSLPWSKITGKPTFFSGSWNDLTDKPTLLKGDTGATGPAGPKGDTGATGATGPQGEPGPGANQSLNTTNNVTFNNISATGKILAAQGSGTNGGFSFSGNEGGNDTGMFSSTDGVLDIYSNNVKMVTVTTGGIVTTQAITLPADPTNNLEAVTKQYVDNAVSSVGGTNTGNIVFNGTAINNDGNGNSDIDLYTNGEGYAEVWLQDNYEVRITADGGQNVWHFQHGGNLELPAGGDIVDSNGVSVLGGGSGVSLPADATGFLANDGTGTLSWASAPAKLVSSDGTYEVTLDNTGAVVLSSYGVVKNPDHVNVVSDGWVQMQWVDSNTLDNADPNSTSGPTNWVYVDGIGIHVETNVNMNIGDSTQRYDWLFDNYGKLQMPAGGDIVDSNGASVLGGGGGSSPTNEITNTDGYNTYSVSVGTNGVISMNTARGGIEFGAMPEVGGPTHLHIMRPAGQEGSTDLYFGDDFNYVKMPGLYGIGSQGVEIGSSFDGGSVSTWRFDTDGKLKLPVGGDIVDSNGTSVLGGGSGSDIGNFTFTDNKITFPDGTIQTTAYVTSEQKGFFTEFTHPSDNNRVDMEAVAVDDAGNSYVSYSYYSDNDNRRYGGIVKLNSSGAVQWTKDITSPSGNPDYVKIASLEFIAITGVGSFLTAYGYYWDNNTNRDVGFNYFLVPETGDLNNSFSTELNVDYATELSDGVFGEENGGPVAVLAGRTYGANLEKQFTILSPSTTDRIYISWEDYAASGLNPGDQLYYYTGGYYGMYVNKFDCTAVAPGASNPWDGLGLQVSVSKDGSNYSYNILRTNGWSGAIYSWPSPQSVTVPGSQLGGTDGVNDLTFDFDPSIFNYNSDNLLAAISNIQGTPYSDSVVCSAWNGKDWSTEIGNTLTFDYQLNNQALITKLGGSGNWTKNLGGTEYEYIQSVTVDSSNNIYAVGYYWKINKGSFVIKYDSTGVEQWAVHIDPTGNTGNTVNSVDMLSDGNIITVADGGIVTKINSSDGSIMWQIMNDGDPSWDSEFKGTATPDGNYIFANYESNNYTMYVICVSGTDGSILWTKQISRNWAGSNGEIYPQNDYDAQYIDCNSTHVVIGATSEIYLNNNNNYSGLVFSLPLDGQDIDGSYGQYIIQSASLNWNTQSTTSTSVVVDIQTIGADTTTVSPNTSNPDFTVAKTNIGGGTETATVAGIERHSATTGDDTITLAEEHNGKFLYYNGSSGSSNIRVPSDSDVNLPIGFTVTVVMDEFNGNYIYVNNNTGSQNATINASGFNYNAGNYWKFGQDGKSGVYTIMKVDTDRWMLAGPDVTQD